MWVCDLYIKRAILFCIPLQEPIFTLLGTVSLSVRMHATDGWRSTTVVLGEAGAAPRGDLEIGGGGWGREVPVS